MKRTALSALVCGTLAAAMVTERRESRETTEKASE